MERLKSKILLFLLLACSISLHAQQRLKQPEYYLGFQAGVLASTTIFDPTFSYTTPLIRTTLLSPDGGIVFCYIGHKYCGLQVEVNYMQRGWKELSESTDTINVNYTRKLHYLEIPLLMHLYFGKRNTKFFINAGPQVGFCLKDDLGSGDRQTAQTRQYEKITHPFEWGIAGGLGFYCQTQKAGTYQLEARFNYSFGTIFASSTMDYFAKSNGMNLSLNLAWLWQIKK